MRLLLVRLILSGGRIFTLTVSAINGDCMSKKSFNRALRLHNKQVEYDHNVGIVKLREEKRAAAKAAKVSFGDRMAVAFYKQQAKRFICSSLYRQMEV